MKHTIKEDSIGAFFRDVLLYPIRPDSSSINDGPALLLGHRGFGEPIKEIQIRHDQGIDVGDIVVFEFTERTNITSTGFESKISFKCAKYDSVSHKLIKE